ncbi:MAG: ABC transporter permease [Nocardioidaceae bacterium]
MGVQATEFEVHSESSDEAVATKAVAGRSPLQIVVDRLKSDKVAIVCLAIVALLILLGLLAPVITALWGIKADAPPTKNAFDILTYDGYPKIGPPFGGFIWKHPLGLEPTTGYDNFARLLYGLRTSLGVSFFATLFSTVIGVVIGLVAGFATGWLDRIIGFTIDLFLSFPFILGALCLTPIITQRFATNANALAKAQVVGLISVLVILGWMGLARLIRGQVLSLREREFIQAARVLGVPTRQILFKELLPNLVAPIVVMVSLTLPAYVAAEASLSYLGIGLTGVPSLGQTINSAVPYFDNYPLYLWAPVAAVAVLVLALNLLGDSVRDAFDPKTRR